MIVEIQGGTLEFFVHFMPFRLKIVVIHRLYNQCPSRAKRTEERMEKQNRIISAKRSVIPAADIDSIKALLALSQAVNGVEGIEAVKIGLDLMIPYGVPQTVETIKGAMPDAKVIFDYQKAGNDIPAMGVKFAKGLKSAGVDAAIIFPFAGPVTQKAWTEALFGEGLRVLTGGIMTHPEFVVSEGGYIADEAVERIYRLACQLGVQHFVVPGNKIKWVKKIRKWLVEELGEGNFVLYAPGFIDQGGSITECGQAAGEEFHGIVGGGIYKKGTVEAMRAAAIQCTQEILPKVA